MSICGQALKAREAVAAAAYESTSISTIIYGNLVLLNASTLSCCVLLPIETSRMYL